MTHVYIVGLALDFCVKHTALHAAEHGFNTTVLSDATKGIDESDEGMKKLTNTFKDAGVKFKSTKEVGLL